MYMYIVHAVVVQQPTPSTGPQFRDLPVVMTDSSGNQYTTELRYVNGLLMWVAVGITCFVAGQLCYIFSVLHIHKHVHARQAPLHP